LIGLNSNYLSVSWKDTRAELLIPFRRFLINASGTYNKAWEMFTAAKSVHRNTCAANLASMFEETAEGLTTLKRQPGQLVSITEQLKDQPANKAALDKFFRTYNTTEKRRKLADNVVNALDLDGGEGDGSLGIVEIEHVWKPVEYQERHKSNTDMMAFQDWVSAHPSYHVLANFWAGLTDGESINKDEFIRVVEAKGWQLIREHLVASGFKGKLDSEICKREADHLFKTLDAQNSNGVSLNELKPSTGDDFRDIDRILLKFSIPLVAIAEIRIVTHRQGADTYQKRLRISIKTQHEEDEEPFSTEKASDGIQHMKGWAAFRKALDPDWQPIPNREYIEFTMGENFFDLWDTVIGESGMRRPQEWVHNYEGQYIEHPLIRGNYLRHGKGAQQWSNGQYYDGEWANHVYSGRGKLYARYEDYAAGVNLPMYEGTWERGKRHGVGKLRWQQDLNEHEDNKHVALRKKGISKIYEGEFKDDLFHGKGRLFLEKVPIGNVAGTADQNRRAVGTYPQFTVDPAQLLEFQGDFEADFVETYLQVKQHDPEWNLDAEEKEHIDEEAHAYASSGYLKLGSSTEAPVMFDWSKNVGESDRRRKAEQCRDLMLEKINLQMKKAGSARYKNFFENMNESSQRSGPPLTDLALKAYRKRGAEAMHFKSGKAKFASPGPGTTYDGEFFRGLPHGDGAMDHAPVTYKGQWEDGAWHGRGILSHDDGYTYKGQWLRNERNGEGLQVNEGKIVEAYGYHAYKGTWMDDQRHGQGEMMFSTDGASSQMFLHEGSFEFGLREGKCEMYFLISDKKKLGKLADKLPTTAFSIESYDDSPDPTTVAAANKKSRKGRHNKNDRDPISQRRQPGDVIYYKLLYFSGWFESDNIPKRRRSWLHLVNPTDNVYAGSYYYGHITEDGKRQGEGTLYSAEAGNDDHFIDCVMSGQPYTKERLVCEACHSKDPRMLCCPHNGLERDHLKFLTYDGQWHNNIPHGVGVQFYPDVKMVGGVYYGDFKEGFRHGRGTWQVRDRSFTYMPLPKKKQVTNWKNDMMHGVANVEDSKYVHENVVYKDNKTMMPFASVGPPSMNFDQVAGWNVVFQGVRIVSHQRKIREKSAAAPKSSMSSSSLGAKRKIRPRSPSKASLSSEGSNQGVWAQDDTKIMQRVVKHHGILSTEQFRNNEEEQVNLLREPTELTQRPEDVLLSGGTGENEAMNGYYVRVTKSFGHSLWRMVKRESGVLGLWARHSQRYIYREDSKRSRTWCIGPAPLAGRPTGAGCAFAEDVGSPPRRPSGRGGPSGAPCRRGW